MIDPRVLRVDAGLNVRDFEAPENRAHLEFLKASIRTEGVKQPLTVRHGGNPDGDGFVPLITDGECRWRAVMELIDEGVEIARVPCQPEGRDRFPRGGRQQHARKRESFRVKQFPFGRRRRHVPPSQ